MSATTIDLAPILAFRPEVEALKARIAAGERPKAEYADHMSRWWPACNRIVDQVVALAPKVNIDHITLMCDELCGGDELSEAWEDVTD